MLEAEYLKIIFDKLRNANALIWNLRLVTNTEDRFSFPNVKFYPDGSHHFIVILIASNTFFKLFSTWHYTKYMSSETEELPEFEFICPY
jgi:hypothetical protein